MIEICIRGCPVVVEGAYALHAKAVAHLFLRLYFDGQVFVGDVFESHFRAFADVQRDRSVSIQIVIVGCGAHASAHAVQIAAHDVRVEHNLQLVPLSLAHVSMGHGDR